MPNDAQMKIRISSELRDRIAAEAEQNNRSMNSEIVARLEKSFGPSADKYDIDLIMQMLKKESERSGLRFDLRISISDAITEDDLKNPTPDTEGGRQVLKMRETAPPSPAPAPIAPGRRMNVGRKKN